MLLMGFAMKSEVMLERMCALKIVPARAKTRC